MDVAALMEEFRQAQEEHARALAEAQQMRENLERAKAEYASARATEQRHEQDVAKATELLTKELSALDVSASGETLCVAQSLVEFQANIGCYHCYLQIEGGRYATIAAQDLRVSVQFPCVRLRYQNSVCWETEIEYNIDITTVSIAVQDDHIHVRLRVKDGDKPVTDPCSSFSRVSAAELQPESYKRMTCRDCGHALLSGSIEKALPLPSANWMEMMDFWGAGIGSFEHIPREGIFAQSRRVLVGEDHVLLHSSDLAANAWTTDETKTLSSSAGAGVTVQDEDDEADDWVDIGCSACRSELGQRSRENESTLRLLKHRIAVSSAEDSDNETTRNIFSAYSSDSAVCAKLLLAAETDGIFRFRLTPLASNATSTTSLSVLRLQLLSWDTMLRLTGSASSFVRVLKVTFSTEDSGTQLAPELASRLPPSMRVQEMSVSGAVLDALHARLEATSQLLPASQRAFNKMRVGYLYT